MIFVSSWDDGHPLDERVAELLHRYGLKGTFFVPVHNREGHAVMMPSQIQSLDTSFEIASHTLDHIYLTTLSAAKCEEQIREGKYQLEAMLGHSVSGFCYPGGKWNTRIRQAVTESGFQYARGISNLWLEPNSNVYNLPTTAQFFPHRTGTLWRNYLKEGYYRARLPVLLTLSSGQDWLSSLQLLATQHAESTCIFHIWGHSWEIERHCLWPQLRTLLAHVASLQPRCLTVAELARQLRNKRKTILTT